MMRAPNINSIISILVFSTLLLSGCTTHTRDVRKPNIVIIFADDMGYGDVSALNPAGRIQTPAIDRLIRKGISFTEAHASASVCTPSRYGLLTGRYAFRNEAAAKGISGFEGTVIEKGRETIATLLRQKGYATACIGKWHLGLGWQTKDGMEAALDKQTGYSNVDFGKEIIGGPNDYGFDYSFIHPASLDIPPYVFLKNHQVVEPNVILTTDVYPSRLENTVFSWDKKHSDSLAVYWQKGVWWRQGEMSKSFRVEDCLNTIVNEGVDFIDRQAASKADHPFLLYLPLTGPHTPWVPAEEFKDRSPIGLYGDFVMNVDHMVGQIIETLERNGLRENTILIFSSDNGAYWPQEEIELHHHDSNIGRRGQKGDIWDGGHRVPLIISWPAKIKQASVYTHLVSLTDLYATLSDLTGQVKSENAGEDSFSFWPVLNGELDKSIRPSMVHNSSGNMYGIRKGEWKYIQGLGSGGFTAPSFIEPKPGEPHGQLYNLALDHDEQNNLYGTNPKKVQELKMELENIQQSR